jgi:hypothetical protein
MRVAANAKITAIEYDPPGYDVNGEHIVIRNTGGNAIDLTGWTLRDAAPLRPHRYTFKHVLLAPGSAVRVWTKGGQDTESDVYWGLRKAVWNNTGDTAVLRDRGGAEVSRFRYPRGSQISMVGLGVANDTPPHPLQPPLVDGIHLRWASPRADGFPWAGYYLFRRPHRAGVSHWLSTETSGLVAGPWSGDAMDLESGRLSSDLALLLTDDFLPAATVEFDLEHRNFLRFRLAKNASARKWELRIGFRDLTELPPKVCVDFEGRATGSGPNPRFEKDPSTQRVVTFEARHKDGTPRPNTHIQQMRVGSSNRTGLSCEAGLAITLPGASTYIEITLSSNADAATVEAFNSDGSLAGRKTSLGPETVRIDGSAITSALVHAPRGKTLIYRFCCQPKPTALINITGFAGRVPVTRVSGKTSKRSPWNSMVWTPSN